MILEHKTGLHHRIRHALSAVFMLASIAAAAPPTDSNIFTTARLRLKNGREFQCSVLGREGSLVSIKRSLGGLTEARESYSVAEIEGLYFQKPVFLSITQDVSTAASRAVAISNAYAEYARWRQYEDIKGSWAAPVAFQLAELLEQNQDYTNALALYTAVRTSLFPTLSQPAAVRCAVCLYYTAAPSNAIVALTNTLGASSSYPDCAELNYYIGRTYAKLGDHVAALFSLLRNVVFYSSCASWEVRSLTAALDDYAALGQADQYVMTCDLLLRRFPDTMHGQLATNALMHIYAGSNMSDLVSFTQTLKELP